MTPIEMVATTCHECDFPLSAMDEARLTEGIRAHYAFAHPLKPRHVDLPEVDRVCDPEPSDA